MHFYYAYFLLFISFLNYAQQISNDRYLQKRWPADEETQSLFEQAKEKLAKNPNDEDGKKALTLLGEREFYIPALNALTDHALEQHDFDRAFHLSYVGHLYGDQQLMYKHAYLLLNPHLCFQLKDADPRPLEIIAKNLLMHAAQPISLEMEEGQVSHIHFPCASRLLVAADNDPAFRAYQDGLAHSFMLERSLDNADQKTREEAENDARENDDTTLGCYFIKRYLNQPQDSLNAKKGLDLVQHFTRATFFNYDQFIRLGGYRAVQRLAQNIQTPDHARAAYLLGCMDYQRISFDGSIDRNQLEENLIKGAAYEPTAYLMLAALSAEPAKKIKWMEELIKKLDKVEPEACAPTFIALVRGYHAVLHANTGYESLIASGLSRLIKHNSFKLVCDEITANAECACELGVKLLQIRDKVVLHGKSKDRADHRKIRDAGLSLTQIAARAGNEQAAWALVDHSLPEASTSSANAILDEHLATAIINTQAQIEHGNPSTVSGEKFQRILTKINPVFLSPESSQALAYWYVNGVPGVVDIDERKGISYLSRVKEVGPIMCQLIEEGKMRDPRTCFEAAVLLYTKHSDEYITERNLLFYKAILHADIPLKKEIINYCLEHEPLVELATRAFNAYSNDLPKSIESPEELQNEFVYQKSCIDILMKWAVGKKYSDSPDISKRSKPAIMFLYELKRTNASDQGPWDKEDADTFDFLAYWAATQGYEPALTALEIEFQEAKRDMVFVDRAVSFWEAWLKVYSKDVTKAAEIAQVRSKIDELSRVSLEKNEKGSPFILNCRTHYRLANMFIDRGDHNKAMEHIAVGQICANSEIHCQDTDELINKTDTLPRIEQAAREGQAWAQYTLAKIKTQRIEHFAQVNFANPDHCFEEIQTIKDLLRKSESYSATLADADKLDLGEIEYLESAIAGRFLAEGKTEDEALKKRSEHALQKAVDRGYPEAHYTWADKAQFGQMGRGQEILELAVERLCFAADHRVMEAAMVLKDIAKCGFDFMVQCQGNVTRPLLQKVLDTLRKTGLPALQVTVPEKGTVAYGRYLLNRLENLEQAYDIFQKASGEGDVCAYIYLGIMHRDGICVQRSPQTADVYFARAIKESGKLTLNEQIIRALNIADYALSGQLSDNTPLLADCARYRLQLIPHAKNERAACADALGLVETLETTIGESTDPRMHKLIFTSGIMKELAGIAERTPLIECKVRIAKICITKFQRMSSLGLEKGWLDVKNDEYALLVRALAPLDTLLGEIAIGKIPIQFFARVDLDEIAQLITQLQMLVAQGYGAQFQELLGVLQVCSGIFNRDSKVAQAGLSEFKKAEENGDLRAAYMHALVNFYSMDLKDHAFTKEFTMKVGKDLKLVPTPLFPNGRKIGLAELKKLAKNGYAQAACIVARSLVDQKEYKQGADYYRSALEKTPDLASYGLLQTLVLDYSVATDADKGKIPELICTVKKSKEFNYMAPLFASYFKLVHQIGNLTDEQMADGILSAPDGLYHILNAARICQLLDSDSFLAKFQDWVEAREKKWKAEREVQQSLEADMQMLKVYSAYAILEYVYGTLHDERHILSMKKTIQTCCKILTENKLRLDAVPAIANLLHTVSEYGGLTGDEFIRNNDQIIIDLSKRKEKLIADIKWATALKNAYAPIAPK